MIILETVASALRRAALTAALAASLSFATGCGGPASSLAKSVRDMAPDYRFKAPASSEADLGRELRGGQPLTNACFDGDHKEGEPKSSWSKLQARYDDVLSGELKADFGSTLKVPVSGGAQGSSKQSATVTLTDLHIDQLQGVYLNPRSACATDAATRAGFDAPGGAFVKVITRAIKAGSIDVKADSALTSKVSVDLQQAAGVGAITSSDNTDSRTWNGVNLFIADYGECFKVTHQTQTCSNKPIGAGSSCDVASCGFQVKTYDAKTTSVVGALSCQGDAKPSELTVPLGSWAGEKTAPGVSYSVKVTNGQGLNSLNIELHIWNVLSVALDGCK
jgi:hypothetical protein